MSVIPQEVGTTSAAEVAQSWVDAFQVAVSAGDEAQIASLFLDSGTYRDLLVMSWDFCNFGGAEQIGRALSTNPRSRDLAGLSVRPGSGSWVEDEEGADNALALLQFRTKMGRGDGVLRLARNTDSSWGAVALMLELTDLDGHPWAVDEDRPIGKAHGPVAGRKLWHELRDPDFTDAEPQVVVIGGGHNGLTIAARLGRLGVSTLVLERNARVGDNWRNRYPSLALHDPVGADHLPYLPLPATWPEYTPTCKFGDYLEAFASLLDLNVWTGITIESVTFTESIARWEIEVVQSNGVRRRLVPNHLVMATGMNDAPNMPRLPGAEDFSGTIVHSAEFRGGEPWRGKRAIVVGTGVSGHDIAQDLWENGAHVTMLQRGATYVINATSFHKLFFKNYLSGGPCTEDADLLGALYPFSALPSFGPPIVKAAAEMDKELLDGLEAAGFQLGWGPNGEGVSGLSFRENRTGYYYNIGASQLIADGSIQVLQNQIKTILTSGALLEDGSELQADLIVFATGFKTVRESCRPLLGDVVDRLPEINRVGNDGELGGVWRHSGVDRLWFQVSGGIFTCRFYSAHLALQIKAVEEGLMPEGKESWPQSGPRASS